MALIVISTIIMIERTLVLEKVIPCFVNLFKI